MIEDAIPQPATFVRGNDDLDRLLATPQIAADVAQARAEAEEMDRVHAMNLAMIRRRFGIVAGHGVVRCHAD